MGQPGHPPPAEAIILSLQRRLAGRRDDEVFGQTGGYFDNNGRSPTCWSASASHRNGSQICCFCSPWRVPILLSRTSPTYEDLVKEAMIPVQQLTAVKLTQERPALADWLNDSRLSSTPISGKSLGSHQLVLVQVHAGTGVALLSASLRRVVLPAVSPLCRARFV